MSTDPDRLADVERIFGDAISGGISFVDAIRTLRDLASSRLALPLQVRAATAISHLLCREGRGQEGVAQLSGVLPLTRGGSSERWEVEKALALTHSEMGDPSGTRRWASRAMRTLSVCRCDHGTFIVQLFSAALGAEEPSPDELRDADALLRMTWGMVQGEEPRPQASLKDRLADLWSRHRERGDWR